MKHILLFGIALILLFTILKSCGYSVEKQSKTVKVDTIIRYIPKKVNTFKTDTFEVVKYKYKYIDNSAKYKAIIADLKQKKRISDKLNKDSIAFKNALLEALRKRKYTKTFKDSVLTAFVEVETTGFADNIKLKYETKEHAVKETVITKLQEPRYMFYTGVNSSFSSDSFTLGASLGLKDKKGYIYSLGYNTDKKITIDIKIPF